MKNFKIMLAAAICAAAVSCQKDNITDKNTYSEPAVISAGVQTKTSLSGTEIHWSDDDVIAVFDNAGTKNSFTAISTNGSNAEFTGSVTSGTTQIYAVYPYELAVSANGSTLVVTVPADQTSKAGSFAEEHNISVAKAEKTPGVAEVSGVSFQNACALLKFTVPAYISDVQKVTVSSNTTIAGQMSIDFSADAPVCVLSEDAVNSISMTGTYEAGSTFWFVLAPVTLDGITVEVETAKASYSMSTDSQFEMTAGQYRNLGTLNLEKASMTGASAAHTYADGILTGTDVTVSLGIPETTAAYITGLTLQVKNAAGTIVRTLSKDSASAVETIAADAQWPYLPKGDYTVSGTYTLSGVTVKEIETISFTISETPMFEITAVTAHTSYDRYAAGDVAGANSLDGSTIYSVGAGVTVSDAILSNPNYPSLVITDNDSEVQAGNLAGRSLGRHTIKASYTLDGVTAEGSADVEITGLPYTLDTKANDGTWNEEGYVNWNTDGGVRLGKNQWGGEAYISKAFKTPGETKVIINSAGSLCGTGSLIKVKNTVSISVSEQDIYTKTQNGKSVANFSCENKSSLINGDSTVKIMSSYNLESANVTIKSFSIIYGE